jgi:hypothetical protein
MPRHKGKIEAGVKYGQENALKGRGFESLGRKIGFSWNGNSDVPTSIAGGVEPMAINLKLTLETGDVSKVHV